MRTRMVGLVVVALFAAGGALWWSTRGHEPSPSAAVASDATAAPNLQPPPRPSSPEAQQVTEQQEQDERTQLETIATELKLTTEQSDRVIAIVGEMQKARRELFAGLAARTIAIEEVSAKLRDVREVMYASLAKELGDDHARAIRERMRVAHGGEAKN